jgi:hypothetical protein
MQEVLPGVFHWPATHPRINIEVASYWLDEEGVLVDPLVPPDVGLDWFRERAHPPAAVLLSNRHHYRDSGRFVEEFGCSVHCSGAGLHEFQHGEPVQGFEVGDRLPGGAIALAIGGICPDDTALQLPAASAVVLADAVVRWQDGPLGFVPDQLMGDPENDKRAILAAVSRLLDEADFDHLLLAHGGPVIGDGRVQLEALVRAGGRGAFQM